MNTKSGITQTATKCLLYFIAMIVSTQLYSQSKTYVTGNGSGNPITAGVTQLTEVDTLIASWNQIGGISTSLTSNRWSSNITLSAITTLPTPVFAFKFFDESVTAFKVSANGLLTFCTSASAPSSTANNTALPATTLPDKTIAVFWDQFAATGSNDLVYYRLIGTAPNRQLWIKWNSFKIGNPAASNVTFAIVLEETTNKIYFVDMYKGSSTPPSLSATLGLQYNRYYYKSASSGYPLASLSTSYTNNKYVEYSYNTSITDQSVTFNNTDLVYSSAASTSALSTSSRAKTIIPPAASACLTTSLSSAKLFALINLGTDYEFGSTFTDSTGGNITIKGYNTSGTQILSGTSYRMLTKDAPEKLYELNIKSFTYSSTSYSYTDLSYLTVSISNYRQSTNTKVQAAVNLKVWTETQYKVDATSSSSMITLNTVNTTSKPVQFSWSASCPNMFPKYEFQLLRLYNEGGATYYADITKATGTIDWAKATSIIVDKGVTSLSLHLTEGTGHYAWRVRPIGNYYEGDEANSKNWGAWSTSYPEGGTFNLTSTIPGNYVFYYTQFDAGINWIYNRVFTEDNNIGENMSYGDGLGRVKQSQHHIQSDDKVLINQQLYDYSGRPALKSMTGPVTRDYFDYEELFLTSAASKLYRAKDFDSTTTYKNPSAVQGGGASALATYYSNSNADKRIPNSDGYPYSRTLYYADGTNRPKEIATPGKEFRIGSTASGDDRTIKIYYSAVADDELVRVFGNEAMVDTSVHKMIQVDPNKVVTVTYQTVDGKTIATCLADGGDNALLDDISNSPFTVSDTIQGNMPSGTYSYCKEKTVMMSQPDVTFWVSYDLSPSEIAATCGTYCSTCDYKVYGYIKENGIVIWDTTIVIPASACSSGKTYSFNNTLTTEVASYTVGRLISVNNEDPSSSSSNTYLENHQEEMASIMDDHLAANFTTPNSSTANLITMRAYLESGDVDGFYDYLDAKGYAIDEDITITTECCTLTVPVDTCPPHPCDAGTPDFEKLLYTLHEDKYGNAFQNYSKNSDVFIYPDNGTLTPGVVEFTSNHDGVYESGSCGTYFIFHIDYTGADGAPKKFNLNNNDTICLDDWHLTSTSTSSDITSAVFSELKEQFDNIYGDTPEWPYTMTYDMTLHTISFSPNLASTAYKGVMEGTVILMSPNFTVSLANCAFGYTPSGSGIFPYGIGAFNKLIENMIADGYDCKTLYDYWYSLCGSFDHESETNIVESFLKSVGTMYGQASAFKYGATGYLSNAHKVIKYTSGTCADCESQYGYPSITADTKTEADTDKDWYQFYTCTQTCTGESIEEALSELGYTVDCDGTNDVACAQSMVDLIEDTCNVLCMRRAASFEAAIREEYAAAGIGITEDKVVCLVEALINNCQGECDVTVYKHLEDTTDDGISNSVYVLDSVGSPTQIENMQKALTWSFDIQLPGTGSCAAGYKTISDNYSYAYEAIEGNLIYELNKDLKNNLVNASVNHDTSLYGVRINVITAMVYYYYGYTVDPFNCTAPTTDASAQYKVDSSSYYFYLYGGQSVYLHCRYWGPTTVYSGDNIPMTTYSWKEGNVLIYSLSQCSNMWTCGPICFKWVEPVVNRVPDTVSIESCEEDIAAYLLGIMDVQLQDCKDHYITDITNTYNSNCASPSNIDDVLAFGYSLGYFHYTLFYYDRAGNLIATVPPKGVDESSTDRNTSPAHKYVTHYEYNSRKQLVAKKTPDGGRTEYYYNDLGQLRFSQNAQQAIDNKYSYLKYDDLSRVVEAGQGAICSSCDITSVAGLSSKVNSKNIPSGGKEQTFTVYNDAVSGIAYVDADGVSSTQKYLQNRISYVYTDDDGSSTTLTDRNYTYYSYDPHGNVVYLIQAVNGLGNKQIGFEYDLVSGKITKVKYQEGQVDQYFYEYNYDADNRLTSVRTSRDNRFWDTDATYKYFAYGPLERKVLGEDKIQGLDYLYTLQGWLKAINHPQLGAGNDYGKDGVAATANEKIPADAFGMVLNYYKGDFNRTGSVFNNGTSSSTGSIVEKLAASHGGYGTSSNDFKSYYNGFISNTISNNAAAVTNNPGQPMAGMYLYDELGRLTQNTVDFYSGTSVWGGSTGSSSDYYEQFKYDENGNITNVLRNGY